jgi:hypothetical protein
MTRPQFKHSKTIERWTQSLVSNHRDAADVAWSTVMVCPFVPLDPFKVLSGRPELQVFAVLRAARPYPLGSMQAPLFFPLFTLWLSMMAAVGLGPRSPRFRHST